MSTRRDIVLGCVGKPSAGKSSFLNAATDANAKVGNYPFTTIEPNLGVSWYAVECACVAQDKVESCKPRYGKCRRGRRLIPVKVLDVAGLVPGASEGIGLGNQFLSDLCGADVLLHVVDVSGTTNEKGEEAEGYDPLQDVDWLTGEIHAWIFNNLWSKWGNVVRRHVATKSALPQTLQRMLSGYGSRIGEMHLVCDKMGVEEPFNIEAVDEDWVRDLVTAYMEVRFPTILVLNKIDLPDSDRNISRIYEHYDEDLIVTTSALAEIFLRKMEKSRYIRYEWGDEGFETAESEAEAEADGALDDSEGEREPLVEASDKVRKRLAGIEDMVLFRYGSTGVADVIQRAIDHRGLFPVYPVGSLTNFSAGDNTEGAFRDVYLVRPGTTVRELAARISSELENHYGYCEQLNGTRVGEDTVLTPSLNILRFVKARGATGSTATTVVGSTSTA